MKIFNPFSKNQKIETTQFEAKESLPIPENKIGNENEGIEIILNGEKIILKTEEFENKTSTELSEIIKVARIELEKIEKEIENLKQLAQPEETQEGKMVKEKEEINIPPEEIENKLIGEIKNEISEIQRILETSKDRSKKKKRELQEYLDYLNQKLLETKEEIQLIEEDRREKPFLYFVFNKLSNEILINKYKNKGLDLFDLRELNKKTEEIKPVLPSHWKEREGEIVYQYNIYGFIKTIRDINKFIDRDISSNSNLSIKALEDTNKNWNIIGPDGNKISNEDMNWDEATKIYSEESKKRKEKLADEFEELELNSLGTKEEKIQYLEEKKKNQIDELSVINNRKRDIRSSLATNRYDYTTNKNNPEQENLLKPEKEKGLKLLEESPERYLENEIKNINEDDKSSQARKIDIEETINKIKYINKKYDAKIAKLKE